jgi:hypothetical protein
MDEAARVLAALVAFVANGALVELVDFEAPEGFAIRSLRLPSVGNLDDIFCIYFGCEFV